jgi:photosystem II stability/assembly factor-like uncharacterized protein
VQVGIGYPHFLDARVGWVLFVGPCNTSACVDLLVSEDGGVTWHTASRGVPIRTSASVSLAPRVHVATTTVGWVLDGDNGMLRTEDGGATWRSEATEGAVAGIQAHGSDVWRLDESCPSNALACKYVLNVSSDTGQTWQRAPTQPPVRDVVASFAGPSAEVAYVLSDSVHGGGEGSPDPLIARTSDGGRSWTTRPAPCSGFRSWAHETFFDLAVSEPNDLWLVCGDEPFSGAMQPKHLFRSSDGGRSWSQDLGTPNGGAGGRTVAGSPKRACRGGGRTSIACTSDGGHTWRYPNEGKDNPLDGGVDVIQFTDELHAWATGQSESADFNVLWRTTDGGDSWSPVSVRPID